MSTIFDPDRFLRHFFLTAEPFALTPDPEFLFLSEGHADALAAIELGVMEKRGLITLTGEVGTGKTTLAHAVVAEWRDHLNTAYLNRGTFSFSDILRKALHQFGLPSDGDTADCLDRLGVFLEEQAERGKIVVLLIDEAQNLPAETFEQLRLLLNFETAKQKLLQMVLIGQPELDERLRTPELRHIEGRVAVRSRLRPLTDGECRAYIDHRLSVAGGDRSLFDVRAVDDLIAACGGIPRRLNVFCHNALLFAYGRSITSVDRACAQEAIRRGRLDGPAEVDAGSIRGLVPFLRTFLPGGERQMMAAVLAAAIIGALLASTWLRGGGASTNATSATEVGTEIPSNSETEGRSEAGANTAESSETGARPATTEPGPSQAAGPSTVRERFNQQLRTHTLKRGESLSGLILSLYGRYDNELLAEFARINPDLGDLDLIPEGTAIRLPESAPADAETRR